MGRWGRGDGEYVLSMVGKGGMGELEGKDGWMDVRWGFRSPR